MHLDLTERQQKLLSSLPALAAILSAGCCLSLIFTVLSSRYYRSRIFHRIMLGCAINILCLNCVTVLAPYATPKGSSIMVNAKGSEATCSAQGFMQHMFFAVPFYFFALALLCYVSIRNKFQDIPKTYAWMEKWIHVGAYLYPIASGCYLLKRKAFNSIVRGCGISSVPLRCGENDEQGEPVVCTRGPQNIFEIRIFFIAFPLVLLLLLTTIALVAAYWQVRGQGEIAPTVAKQAALFLFLTFIWTYLFRAVDTTMLYKKKTYFFCISLLAHINLGLQGLWTSIIYHYFRSREPPQQSEEEIDFEKEEDASTSGSVRGCLRPLEFSIFDGTNLADSDSPWREFLHEGDEDEDQRSREYNDSSDYFMQEGRRIVEVASEES